MFDARGHVEVGEVGVAGVVQEDVVGLDVPVDDAPAPQEIERGSDLGTDEADHLLGEVKGASIHVIPKH